jgi:hypothetical protein
LPEVVLDFRVAAESVMKPSPEEEGRIIAQSRFDVNEEM